MRANGKSGAKQVGWLAALWLVWMAPLAASLPPLAGSTSGVLTPPPVTHIGSPDYERLAEAASHYRRIARRGGWPSVPPGPTLTKGDEGERVAAARRRLLVSGELKDNDPESEFLYDIDLENAVKHFQRTHALTPTGDLDEDTRVALNLPVQVWLHTIDVNLERWRWLPHRLGSRYVLVDIAGFRVLLYEDGKPVLAMKAIVGGLRKETPIFKSSITQIALNPWWNIPREIAIDEVLPELKAHPEDVASDNVRAAELSHGKWKSVRLASVDWTKVTSKNFKYQLRQAPGPENPLGAIKFVLPNRYAVYLHGTADPELFESDTRAVSHGCVRVEQPVELALALLGKSEKAETWTEDKIRETLKQGRQLSLSLSQPVPVYFDYLTAWVDDEDGLTFRKDVYGWDEWDRQLVNSLRFGAPPVTPATPEPSPEVRIAE